MANTGQIIKSKTTEKYTVVINEVIKTNELTLEEKGFLVYLLHLPSHWVLYRKNLYNSLPDSKGTIDRVFKSLRNKGYILSVKVRNADGSFAGWNHVVYDTPASNNIEIEDDGDPETSSSINMDLHESNAIVNTNSLVSTDSLVSLDRVVNTDSVLSTDDIVFSNKSLTLEKAKLFTQKQNINDINF
jgi:hypothetical protein